VVANPTSALVAYNCGNPGPACQAVSTGYAEQCWPPRQLHGIREHSGGHYNDLGRCAHGRPGGGRRLRRITDRHAVCLGRHQPTDRVRLFGVVVWAYGLAGVVVPRVANDQWRPSPMCHGRARPGDLVFFGSGSYADHVGIYVGDGAMVDAPYTGADVRIDTIPLAVALPGATR